MKITKQALLDRGFKEITWFDETHHTEYLYQVPSSDADTTIEIALNKEPCVQVVNEDGFVQVPNCRTVKQLDALIDLFKEV